MNRISNEPTILIILFTNNKTNTTNTSDAVASGVRIENCINYIRLNIWNANKALFYTFIWSIDMVLIIFKVTSLVALLTNKIVIWIA